MRELTEEEALKISGGVKEGASLVTTNAANRILSPLVTYAGVVPALVDSPRVDMQSAVDTALMES